MQYNALSCTTPHCTGLNPAALQSTSQNYTALPYTALHCPTSLTIRCIGEEGSVLPPCPRTVRNPILNISLLDIAFLDIFLLDIAFLDIPLMDLILLYIVLLNIFYFLPSPPMDIFLLNKPLWIS